MGGISSIIANIRHCTHVWADVFVNSTLSPLPAPFTLGWPSLLETIRDVLSGSDVQVYLVGGAVRDALLRRRIHDLDFATAGDGRRIAKRIADRLGGAYYPLDSERRVGRAIVQHEGERYVIDVAAFRGHSLLNDLTGRDFTLNAMAVALDGDLQSIIDPLGGLQDLSQKRLRRCSPNSLPDDPVRALRAIRQSVALGLQIEAETRNDLRRYGPDIRAISAERVRDEFMTILGGPRPHGALRTLDALGLLTVIVPEVEAMRGVTQSPPHVYDVWEHSLSVVERLYGILTTISPARTEESAADAALGMVVYLLDRFRPQLQTHLEKPFPNQRSFQSLLILTALLHDCAKPNTRSIDDEGRIHFYQHEQRGAEMALERATALRLSNEEMSRLEAIIRHHLRPMLLRRKSVVKDPQAGSESVTLSRRTIHRFWRATGEAGIDVCLLTLADYLGMVGVTFVLQDWIAYLELVGSLLDAYFNQRDSLVTPPTLVTGYDLMEQLTLPPGPAIGRLLAAISEAQATGEISNAAEALALARFLQNAPELVDSHEADGEDGGEDGADGTDPTSPSM